MGRVPLAVATVPAEAILKNCRRFGCWGVVIFVSSMFYFLMQTTLLHRLSN
jgi:hypothetical protein